MVGGRDPQSAHVVVGVDTDKDEHVAVAIDQLGARLSEHRVATTTPGYADLERWSCSLGEVRAFGVEGTGAYDAGLSRFLTSRGRTVVEVNRPDRSTRRRKGKSDPIDAEMAARAVLANLAHSTPKSGGGKVEMIRMLRCTRSSALKARTQALNQIQAFIVTAPDDLRESLRGVTASKLVSHCTRLRPGELATPTAVAKHTLRSLSRRCHQLTVEIKTLGKELCRLTAHAAPALLKLLGVGPDTAATLLVTAGSNPEFTRRTGADRRHRGPNGAGAARS
jgi:transposase